MKNKNNFAIIIICIIAVCLLFISFSLYGINLFLTNLIEDTNVVCKDQKFSSVEEAILAMETEERKINDTSLDYCPPYSVKYSFDYDDNTIVFYSYCHDFDGNESEDYAVRILKHNSDGTMSFDSGFADFVLREPKGNEDYYYFTNIDTNSGNKSISFLYLSKGSNKNIFVDGEEMEKTLVTIDDKEFYICYAISNRDTFFSNFITPVSKRHKIKID